MSKTKKKTKQARKSMSHQRKKTEKIWRKKRFNLRCRRLVEEKESWIHGGIFEIQNEVQSTNLFPFQRGLEVKREFFSVFCSIQCSHLFLYSLKKNIYILED